MHILCKGRRKSVGTRGRVRRGGVPMGLVVWKQVSGCAFEERVRAMEKSESATHSLVRDGKRQGECNAQKFAEIAKSTCDR